jgi:hypothetical protein
MPLSKKPKKKKKKMPVTQLCLRSGLPVWFNFMRGKKLTLLLEIREVQLTVANWVGRGLWDS